MSDNKYPRTTEILRRFVALEPGMVQRLELRADIERMEDELDAAKKMAVVLRNIASIPDVKPGSRGDWTKDEIVREAFKAVRRWDRAVKKELS